ncbi:bifunctional phosphopantothenoylcysteine decarboxylase/phosphopantothenate--cysteine ligase CoaBC [Massilimicrobiota timonensis]|uniref:Coenzyme A biosynthesis bifunctional protein CoaBC n=1 Tax=Massilimicrobiota timonensis TaxID=1776392 RepID=A0ABT7UFM0_9FIRM|nr:bifunctional phosphopantothenoylcysteine decarboxylase/phosphopantothenate--cysteine ligase CoaBC [Massilimicrobiota timonensis]MDM8194936.1 bifunctional phosphopantothenoylcysteine decarboxylase/phosphopantothenate--cysteine ligase CoaBC [Massilimicrobiota timonensis]MEE0778740.1 bifunctional phosphopantothenoylcysteine decarboxylase/phosphopantothenate--cysteine ligase CoaBC [Massilimicrobiota sp.]
MSKKIIIGITGSVAAFKSIQLISDLVKQGYQIEVMMSESATRFVTPVCIQSLTKRKVYVDTFDDENPAIITHVDIVKDADLFMVVPASAHTIAKLAYGMADNMLTSAFLAATCPKLIAPAMNVHMYENPITQKNMQLLKETGVVFVEPISGLLACGDTGNGKLADEDTLLEMIDYMLAPKTLSGKNILISAGPTQESLDPVRFITNHSSGKMGYALAKAAFQLGANVTLVSGPTHLKKPHGVNVIDVISANDMYHQIIQRVKEYDYMIMSAAVGDYACNEIADEKIKKHTDTLTLELHKNKDILLEIGKRRLASQVICGFAMETSHLIENAQMKLQKKNCDMIVANHLKTDGAGFQGDTNVVSILTQQEITDYQKMSKQELAYIILNQMKKLEEEKC